MYFPPFSEKQQIFSEKVGDGTNNWQMCVYKVFYYRYTLFYEFKSKCITLVLIKKTKEVMRHVSYEINYMYLQQSDRMMSDSLLHTEDSQSLPICLPKLACPKNCLTLHKFINN